MENKHIKKLFNFINFTVSKLNYKKNQMKPSHDFIYVFERNIKSIKNKTLLTHTYSFTLTGYDFWFLKTFKNNNKKNTGYENIFGTRSKFYFRLLDFVLKFFITSNKI